MVTLADFMLARIAEDERNWQLAADRGNPYAARIMVECETKRRIVERCAQRIHNSVRDDSDGAWEIIDDDAWATLYDLALPYADHKDYRKEEWHA